MQVEIRKPGRDDRVRMETRLTLLCQLPVGKRAAAVDLPPDSSKAFLTRLPDLLDLPPLKLSLHAHALCLCAASFGDGSPPSSLWAIGTSQITAAPVPMLSIKSAPVGVGGSRSCEAYAGARSASLLLHPMHRRLAEYSPPPAPRRRKTTRMQITRPILHIVLLPPNLTLHNLQISLPTEGVYSC